MSVSDQQKVTLEQWVNEHEKLLTVTGIFGALTAYFSSLSGYAKYLAFVSLTLFILLTVETYLTFPWSRASNRLYYFAFGFVFLIVYSGYYFVQIYWRPLLSSRHAYTWFGYIYIFAVSAAFERLKVFRWMRSYKSDSKWRKRIVVLGVFAGLFALIAILTLATGELIQYAAPSLWNS
jgi:hypothetical protein